MTIRKIDELVKMSNHPLEDHFDIESGTTEMVVITHKTELVEYVEYDEKDKEIEEDYQIVMDKAFDVISRLEQHIEAGAEAKYLSRLSEVLGQHLNIALGAIDKKAKLKVNKDTLNIKKNIKQAGNTYNDITIKMDRNDVVKAFLVKDDDIIDAEMIDLDNEDNDNE